MIYCFYKALKYLFIISIMLIIGFFLMNYYPDKSLAGMKTKYANVESEFVLIDGMQVHYRDEGNPKDSIPVVLLHGTSSFLQTWDTWVVNLVPIFRVIRMDLPAYGLTGPNSQNDYSSLYYTNFIHQLFGKLGVKKCYLVGNSLGGKIAWEYALKYPQEVKKIILIDAAAFPRKQKKMPLAFRLTKMPVLKDLLLKITPKAIIRTSLIDVYGDDTKVNDSLVNRYHDMACREGNRMAFVKRASIDFDENYKNISKIKIPSLVLWGEADTWIPIQNAYLFHDALPNDSLITYKGVGHVPMEEIGEQTVKDAIKFLLKK